MLNTSGESAAATGAASPPHRSPPGRDVVAHRPEIFTFGEADRAAQKFSQLGMGAAPPNYRGEELVGGSRLGYGTELGGGGVRRVQGQEVGGGGRQGLDGGGSGGRQGLDGGGGGRHVRFEEEGRRGDARSPFPIFGSNYSTIV
jgi:hypothetical protein